MEAGSLCIYSQTIFTIFDDGPKWYTKLYTYSAYIAISLLFLDHRTLITTFQVHEYKNRIELLILYKDCVGV